MSLLFSGLAALPTVLGALAGDRFAAMEGELDDAELFLEMATLEQPPYLVAGLGLAIARSLCMLHGGALRIRSEVGVGTVVMVRVPAAAEEPALVS